MQRIGSSSITFSARPGNTNRESMTMEKSDTWAREMVGRPKVGQGHTQGHEGAVGVGPPCRRVILAETMERQ